MKKLLTAFVLLTAATTFAQTSDTEWDDYFMPGVGYKMYVPKNHDTLGIYQGVMTEFVIYARAKAGDSRWSGPARIKTYGNLSIMNSDSDYGKDIFYANMGLNLSFEANTFRRVFIPYFGLEMGGLFQRNFSTFQFSPVVGIQLLSTKIIIWNIQGGYQYTTQKFDEYSGYTFSSTLNVLLWNRK